MQKQKAEARANATAEPKSETSFQCYAACSEGPVQVATALLAVKSQCCRKWPASKTVLLAVASV